MFHYQASLNRSGYGVTARGLFRGFEALGLAPQFTSIYGTELDEKCGDDPSLVQAATARRVDPFAPVVKLWHHHSELTTWASRGRRALYTFFEVDGLPAPQIEELNRQTDEIWVASRWAAAVLSQSGYSHEVRVLAPGVDPAVFHACVKPAGIEGVSPSTFVFVTAGKWSLNKGHDALLAAFNAAFRPTDDVALVCCCFNGVKGGGFDGPAESANWARWYRGSPLGLAGKIHVFDHPLPSQREVAALFARADCGVFSYRAEGFCLELFEMAAMGKSLVATACSAPAEYLDEIGAVGVEPDGREAAYDPPFFFGDGSWAKLGDGYVGRLAEALRAVCEAGRGRANAAGLKWAAAHPWDRVAERAGGYLGVCPSNPTSPSASPAKTASSPSSSPSGSPAGGATGGPTTSGSR